MGNLNSRDNNYNKNNKAGPGSSFGRALDRVVRAHVPVTKVRGFEARRALDIYEPPDGYGCGWWQAAAR